MDQGDRDALVRLGDEGIGEPDADRVVVEDVRLHVHVVACRGDGIEHRSVRRRPVLEQRRPVAVRERRIGDRLLDREMARDDVGLRAARELGDDLPRSFRREDAAVGRLDANVVGVDLAKASRNALSRGVLRLSA